MQEEKPTIKDLFDEFLNSSQNDQVDTTLFVLCESFEGGWSRHKKGFFPLLEEIDFDYANAGLSKDHVLQTVKPLYSHAVSSLINNTRRDNHWAEKVLYGRKHVGWFDGEMDCPEAKIPNLSILVSRFDGPEFLGFTSQQISEAIAQAQKILGNASQPTAFKLNM